MSIGLILGALSAIGAIAGAAAAFWKWREHAAAVRQGRVEASLERAEEEAKRAKEARRVHEQSKSKSADDLERDLNQPVGWVRLNPDASD